MYVYVTYTCLYGWLHISVYVCVYVCMYVRMYACMYVYRHRSTYFTGINMPYTVTFCCIQQRTSWMFPPVAHHEPCTRAHISNKPYEATLRRRDASVEEGRSDSLFISLVTLLSLSSSGRGMIVPDASLPALTRTFVPSASNRYDTRQADLVHGRKSNLKPKTSNLKPQTSNLHSRTPQLKLSISNLEV